MASITIPQANDYSSEETVGYFHMIEEEVLENTIIYAGGKVLTNKIELGVLWKTVGRKNGVFLEPGLFEKLYFAKEEINNNITKFLETGERKAIPLQDTSNATQIARSIMVSGYTSSARYNKQIALNIVDYDYKQGTIIKNWLQLHAGVFLDDTSQRKLSIIRTTMHKLMGCSPDTLRKLDFIKLESNVTALDGPPLHRKYIRGLPYKLEHASGNNILQTIINIL